MRSPPRKANSALSSTMSISRMSCDAVSLGIPVYYYISPKVWAWKEHRVKAIKRYVRKVFCIFPFEVAFYRDRHDYAVDYVGNPSK